MKYKTLFRLLVRYLGLTLMLEGGISIIAGSVYLLIVLPEGISRGFSTMFAYPVAWLIGGIVSVGLGHHFLFSGEWLVNRIIPANHPYCPHCAYDVSGAQPTNKATPTCPECGLPMEQLSFTDSNQP